MANKDFEKMIQMGVWLQRIFNPELQPQEIKRIFKDGMQILNIDEEIGGYYFIDNKKLDKDENVYDWINTFKGEVAEWKKLQNAYHKATGEVVMFNGEPEWCGNENPEESFKLLDELKLYIKKHQYLKEKDTVVTLFSEIQDYNSLLQEILTLNLPWQKAIPKFDKQDCWKKILLHLIADYNAVSNRLILFEERVRVKKGINIHGADTFFYYKVILSNILIDFLFLGGQEYYIYCAYCNQFSVVERKGRKRFCSDICRTNHRNAELAMR